MIEQRRVAAGVATTADAEDSSFVGLAFSGGGIRSATFCLGILQALACNKLLPKIDFLSTVSGGGYIGTFLGRCFTRETEAASAHKNVESALCDMSSSQFRWLREHGRYISPNGSGDGLTIAAIYLRNWLAVHVMLGLLLVSAFVLVNWVRFSYFSVTRQLEEALVTFSTNSLWWSPVTALAAAAALLWLIPMFWAYWCTQFSFQLRNWIHGLPALATICVVAAAGILARSQTEQVQRVLIAFSLTGCLALGFWVLAASLARWRKKPSKPGVEVPFSERRARAAHTRNLLSRWAALGLSVTLVLLAYAVVDTLAQSLYALLARSEEGAQPFKLLISAAGLSGILAMLFKYGGALSSLLGNTSSNKSGWAVSTGLLIQLFGFVIAGLVVVFWCTLAHSLTWQFSEPWGGHPGNRIASAITQLVLPAKVSLDNVCPPTVGYLATVAGSLFGLVGLLGFGRQFLNLSALGQFYGSRLIRAYLGAADPRRALQDVTKPCGTDDIPFQDYHPEKNGGPLHLISTTLNQTVSGHSHLVDRDRKGLALSVGPAGITVGTKEAALWSQKSASDLARVSIEPLSDGNENAYHLLATPEDGKKRKHTEVEALTVGNWMSISGAAFSTGMGANTRLGLSLLLAFANVRLGYHWDSCIEPTWRKTAAKISSLLNKWSLAFTSACPVYPHLLGEVLSRHHGPNRRHWYLSDGGHFENTACYELIRREVSIIICCDCGADPEYVFEDLSNLVRKARLDFGAEITFLTPQELNANSEVLPACITPFTKWQRKTMSVVNTDSDDSQRFGEALYSGGHATLARVDYRSGQNGVILFIKPTLTGDEPLDVKAYHKANSAFPQETTLDQWFDEAQWESYRCLGNHIGNKIFTDPKLLATIAKLANLTVAPASITKSADSPPTLPVS